MDAIGITTGGRKALQTTAQSDTRMSQMVAIGASAAQTQPFSTLNTVVSLRATVPCWFRVGGTAAANTAGSDYLPANVTWQIKIPQGAILSFIQAAGAGWVSVTPLANPVYGVIPSPVFDWDFTTGALPTGMTWARTGATATYFNSSGVLVTGVAAATPRFDYDPVSLQPRGVLAELAATNLCLYSRDLTQAAWVKTTMTAALTQTGLDGVANSASLITASGANATVLQTITSASATRMFSAYVKRVTGSGVVQMTMDGGTTWMTIAPTAGWTKVNVPSQVLTNPVAGFMLATSGDAIAVDCAQLENSSAATSPIPTTTASVARGGDSGTLTTIPWFNATVGVLACNFTIEGVVLGTNQFAAHFNDGTAANYITVYAQAGGIAAITGQTGIASAVSAQIAGPARTALTPYKTAFGYQAGNFSLAVNGTVYGPGPGAVPSGITTLKIGTNAVNSPQINGWIRRVSYWNQRLTDAQLAIATT